MASTRREPRDGGDVAGEEATEVLGLLGQPDGRGLEPWGGWSRTNRRPERGLGGWFLAACHRTSSRSGGRHRRGRGFPPDRRSEESEAPRAVPGLRLRCPARPSSRVTVVSPSRPGNTRGPGPRSCPLGPTAGVVTARRLFSADGGGRGRRLRRRRRRRWVRRRRPAFRRWIRREESVAHGHGTALLVEEGELLGGEVEFGPASPAVGDRASDQDPSVA